MYVYVVQTVQWIQYMSIAYIYTVVLFIIITINNDKQGALQRANYKGYCLHIMYIRMCVCVLLYMCVCECVTVHV